MPLCDRAGAALCFSVRIFACTKACTTRMFHKADIWCSEILCIDECTSASSKVQENPANFQCRSMHIRMCTFGM